MGSDRLTVMFCCNDDRGTPLGAISGVSIDDVIQLEGPMDFDEEGMPGLTIFRTGIRTWLIVADVAFKHWGYARHVGNIFWDAAEMDRAEVVRLLNHLRTIPGWSCVEAEASLFNAWREREITVEDLERASGA